MATFRIPNPAPNVPPSKAQGLVDRISAAFRDLPDSRKPGNNPKDSMPDAACSAFSVFFTPCPSHLAFQRTLALTSGRNNVQSHFGVQDVPRDVQIRNILDSVEAKESTPLNQGVGDTLWAEGSLRHRHLAVTPALVASGELRVVPLPRSSSSARTGAKDLYAPQPFCEKVKAVGFHVLFTCKPASRPALFEKSLVRRKVSKRKPPDKNFKGLGLGGKARRDVCECFLFGEHLQGERVDSRDGFPGVLLLLAEVVEGAFDLLHEFRQHPHRMMN